ncbi:MAG TPA: HAMP domain-containing histidine kinase [Firmicutes bacterium]|nr:HAMP domain-containing histidine kinase [Bacillota bacterium]
MRKGSITRRWMFNSLAVILAILLVFGVAFVLLMRSHYYKSVEYSLSSRLDSLDAFLEQVDWSNAAGNAFSDSAREFVESFQDKERLEMQIVDSEGEAIVSSTGFEPEGRQAPDFLEALASEDYRGVWIGHTAGGEHVMAVTLVIPGPDGSALGGLRYITSLSQVDRQIYMLIGVMVLVCAVVLFFVMLSGSYFIGSIVRPVAEINRAARQIALGDYDSRIEKKTNDEIGELCDTINYMAGEISAAERMKNDFISSVSHELRTPLTAIKGWAETLRQGGASDQELTEKGLDVIIGEAERLSGIVEELLDFSRMQGGHLVMRFGRTDILAELSEAVFLFRDRAVREGIELLYIEPESLPPVLGDPARLRQVFINVIENAIKYTNRGGLIRVETADMGAHVQIVISDTGVGISKEDLPNIKKKFYKANKTRPGSGIGLALADEIVRRHKGRLDIESEEGVGTTVTILLPVAPPDTSLPA